MPIEKDPESGDGDILRLEEAFFGDILRLPRRLDTLLSSALVFVVAISSSSMVCSLFRQSSALLVILVGAQSLLGVILRGPALPREERAAPPRRTWVEVKSQKSSLVKLLPLTKTFVFFPSWTCTSGQIPGDQKSKTVLLGLYPECYKIEMKSPKLKKI